MNQASIHVGDALDVLQSLPDGHAQMCVTSPPYWGLRDYGEDDQLGLEPTPGEYVQNLVKVFREVRRVLADDGTLWLNIGDSYANATGSGPQGSTGDRANRTYTAEKAPAKTGQHIKEKDLVGIPWRVALALQRDGWYLRSDIIWAKPNPMPESVTDRPTCSHEHIFLLSPSKHYYYDVDAIREEASRQRSGNSSRRYEQNVDGKSGIGHSIPWENNGRGRNKRDVWQVSTKPYSEAHFAVYPTDLILPCIQAGTSKRGQCPDCGAPHERVSEKETVPDRPGRVQGRDGDSLDEAHGPDGRHGSRHSVSVETQGWKPTCECDAGDPEPQTVLDPFAGAGTTGVVSLKQGRDFCGIELSSEYAQMAADRMRREVGSMFAHISVTAKTDV